MSKKILISSILNLSKEPSDFSDGHFEWRADENDLRVSENFEMMLSDDYINFCDSLPDDFFSKLPKESSRDFAVRDFTFIGKSKREVVVSFRTAVEEGGLLRGALFVTSVMDSLSPISSVYHSLSLRALSSGFAHDIRNPLAIISSVADWMNIRLNKSDVDVEKFKEKMDTIKNSIQRMKTLVSGIEASVKNFEFTDDDFYINVSIEKIFKVFCKRVLNEQISLKIDVDKKIAISGDPAVISQVLFNVFSSVVELAIDNGFKKVDISSELERDSVAILFRVEGALKTEKEIFLYNLNSKVIDLMLREEGGGFKLKSKAKIIEFSLQLKRKI